MTSDRIQLNFSPGWLLIEKKQTYLFIYLSPLVWRSNVCAALFFFFGIILLSACGVRCAYIPCPAAHVRACKLLENTSYMRSREKKPVLAACCLTGEIVSAENFVFRGVPGLHRGPLPSPDGPLHGGHHFYNPGIVAGLR